MNAIGFTPQFVINGLFLLPFVAGLIFALVQWPRHPRVSLLVALGCVLVLLAGLTMMGYQFIGIQAVGFDPTLYGIVSFGSSFLRTGGYCLLLVAAFVDRREPKKPRYDEDAPLRVPRRDDDRIQTR